MNKHIFVFVVFNMFFAANVGGSELGSYHACAKALCLCFTRALVDEADGGSDHKWLSSRLWLSLRFSDLEEYTLPSE